MTTAARSCWHAGIIKRCVQVCMHLRYGMWSVSGGLWHAPWQIALCEKTKKRGERCFERGSDKPLMGPFLWGTTAVGAICPSCKGQAHVQCQWQVEGEGCPMLLGQVTT
eukprot:1147877-Pelagomonas_calceolata.AAC.4